MTENLMTKLLKLVSDYAIYKFYLSCINVYVFYVYD